MFYFLIIITVQNSTLLSLLRFSYFLTPCDAQASSAFSALIILSHLPELHVKRSDTRINVKAKQEYQDLLLIK